MPPTRPERGQGSRRAGELEPPEDVPGLVAGLCENWGTIPMTAHPLQPRWLYRNF